MLTQEIKTKIDSARDILVGKVPDPKAQVEQITTALIYKFMDDMDKQAASLPKGKPQFFTNGFEKYAWSKMMDAKLGGQERLNLYVEAIAKMAKNPHLPQLFRDVFKDAFLPYRDPETLNLFLKDINTFSYDHSENLGDAFEYLLSVLGSQGDAGQFRTPRHIIDFIVEVVDPKKDETILDPACGTAGFLISAYKHILKSNKNKPLTPDDKKRLMNNLAGYDISPDMVKLSLVNMYLHGFPSPKIFEYDTLTSEEKWDERFDVMMANPPFMTPTGGIRPHKRFMVQANRSEVLFVDYITEHLNNKGRAGIIVPEGIIFQSSGAYKQLRKSLVEDGLYAVASLPSGVFNPYSGVRTSILFFDNQLAKQSKDILFIKVLNDGFDLGAQRRPIDRNDLPHAVEVLQAQQEAIKTGKKNLLLKEGSLFAWAVPKTKIAESGDHNLSGDRYNHIAKRLNHRWEITELGKLTEIFIDGNWIESKDQSSSGIRLIQTGNIGMGEYLDKGDKARFISEEKFEELGCTQVFAGDVLISRLPDPVGRACIVPEMHIKLITAVDCTIVRFDGKKLLPRFFVFLTLTNQYYERIHQYLTGASRERISRSNLAKIQIPVPPLEVQKEIVDELGGYQKVIDGAKQIIEHHKPSIKVDPTWERVELNNVAEIIGGFAFKSEKLSDTKSSDECLGVVKIGNVSKSGNLDLSSIQYHKFSPDLTKFLIKKNDLLVAMTGATVGKVAYSEFDGLLLNQRVGIIRAKEGTIQEYLKAILISDNFYNYCQSTAGGGAQGNISPSQIMRYEIPLPPIDEQKKIIAVVQAESRHIESAKQMIEIYEEKIKSKIAEVWGE
ncbi:MAG TPA: N-6 DNA methylase [Candidatus Paceibacterota bacterium]